MNVQDRVKALFLASLHQDARNNCTDRKTLNLKINDLTNVQLLKLISDAIEERLAETYMRD